MLSANLAGRCRSAVLSGNRALSHFVCSGMRRSARRPAGFRWAGSAAYAPEDDKSKQAPGVEAGKEAGADAGSAPGSGSAMEPLPAFTTDIEYIKADFSELGGEDLTEATATMIEHLVHPPNGEVVSGKPIAKVKLDDDRIVELFSKDLEGRLSGWTKFPNANDGDTQVKHNDDIAWLSGVDQ